MGASGAIASITLTVNIVDSKLPNLSDTDIFILKAPKLLTLFSGVKLNVPFSNVIHDGKTLPSSKDTK